jgi:hypothetical protein
MNQNTQTPLILRVEAAKNEIMQCVNNALQQYQLPCYFVEPIIKDIYLQVKEGAKNELETTKAQMNGATEVAP